MEGPDGSWAWCVALAACVINFLMAGLGRMSGILYVAFIDMFQVSRQEATVPFSLRSTMRNFLGPVVGILGQQYGVRAVTLVGGTLATVSAAACYFAPNMLWITIFWGVVNGISNAMTTTLPQVVIGQHFEKHYATASGLAFCGSCFGAFIFPVLIEILLQTYALQGAFLITAGILMQIIPAAMILRKPIWLKNSNKKLTNSKQSKEEPKKNSIHQHSQKTADNNVNNTDLVVYNPAVNNDINGINGVQSRPRTNSQISKDSYEIKQTFSWFQHGRYTVAEVLLVAMRCWLSGNKYFTIKFLTDFGSDRYSEAEVKEVIPILNRMYSIAVYKRCLRFIGKSAAYENKLDALELLNAAKLKTSQEELAHQTLRSLTDETEFLSMVNRLETSSALEHFKGTDTVRQVLTELVEVYTMISCNESRRESKTQIEQPKVVDQKQQEKKKKNGHFSGLIEHIVTAVKLNKNPMFQLVCLCRTVHFLTVVPTVTIIVDFAMDLGFLESDGKYIIAAWSAGDLIGRLGLGWVTDRGYVSLPRYMFIVMLVQGGCTASLPFITTYWLMIVQITIFGMLQGSLFIRHPVILTKHLRDSEKSIAMGSINLLSGFIGFTIPCYIGYFRDTLGSYENMFFITGALGSILGVIWLFEPQLSKWADRQRMHEEKDCELQRE